MTVTSFEKQDVINEMMGYLSEEHMNNIHHKAFYDISSIYLELVREYWEQFKIYIKNKSTDKMAKQTINPVSWVCNASMGHGKTTVLICFLKWLVHEQKVKSKVPILLAIRENNMAEEIYRELTKFDEHCVLRLDKDTKHELEQYVPNYQIVIITHSRLKQLTLGYENMQHYRVWEQYPMNLFTQGEPKNEEFIQSRRNRVLIIDEKPDFVNSSFFDIGSIHNSLDWFDNLVGCLDLNPYESQSIRSQITHLIAHELAENTSTITGALVSTHERKSERVQKLITTLQNIQERAKGYDIQHMEKLKAFQKMLSQDRIARIDEYRIRGKVGRKLIFAERIEYSKFKLNTLILDGTCELTIEQYKGYTLKYVKNYNTYSRLTMTQDIINTSVWSRGKSDKTTQIAIDARVKELKQTHEGLFVLPIKADIQKYNDLGTISSEHKRYFEQQAEGDISPINLLNTTGKNHLKDVTALYLTSLPRRNPDHYKAIAISLYGNEVDLIINDEGTGFNWFSDKKLEKVYRGELCSELLQIAHRTALRKIKERTPIHIFVAFDDTKNDPVLEKEQILLCEVNEWYLSRQATIEKFRIQDDSLYRRGDTIRHHAKSIHDWIDKNTVFFNSLPRKLSEIDPQQGTGERFRKWLSKNSNWEDKRDIIIRIFREFGYVIYIDQEDKRETKIITTVRNYEEYIES